MARATGTRNALRMLGGTIALAACSAIISNTVRSQLAQQDVSSELISAIQSDPITLEERGLADTQKKAVIVAYCTCGITGHGADCSARGISYCFYFFTPLTGVSLLLVLFFVKRISLNRGDDQAKKDEAKAWIEGKRQKKQARQQHQHVLQASEPFDEKSEVRSGASQAAGSASSSSGERHPVSELPPDSSQRGAASIQPR